MKTHVLVLKEVPDVEKESPKTASKPSEAEKNAKPSKVKPVEPEIKVKEASAPTKEPMKEQKTEDVKPKTEEKQVKPKQKEKEQVKGIYRRFIFGGQSETTKLSHFNATTFFFRSVDRFVNDY